MLSGFFSSFFKSSQPTVLNYFNSCPELQNLSLALEKLRQKNEALAVAAQQTDLNSLDNRKSAMLKGIVDDFEERIRTFNKEYKETTEKIELERKLTFCREMRTKLENILSNKFQLEVLNARRDYKKTAGNVITALTALSASIAAGVFSGGLAALATWCGFNVTDAVLHRITNTNPVDAETVTILLTVQGTLNDAASHIYDLIQKASSPAPSLAS